MNISHKEYRIASVRRLTEHKKPAIMSLSGEGCMILGLEEANARLNSEDNLVNRFRRLTKAESVCIPTEDQFNNKSAEPSVDDLIKDVSDKVNGAKGLSNAKEILAAATERLKERMIEVDKPIELARIASEMNKIVNGEVDSKKNVQNNIVIYRPTQNNIDTYPVVQALE